MLDRISRLMTLANNIMAMFTCSFWKPHTTEHANELRSFKSELFYLNLMERVHNQEALRQDKYKTTGHTPRDRSLEFCSVSKYKGREAVNERAYR